MLELPAHTLMRCYCGCAGRGHTERAENMIEWPLKSTSIDANDRFACFLKCHGHCSPHPPPPAPLTCPFFPLLVTQHGHADGGLPAVSPEHLWCHTFPSAYVDRWGGWSHAVAPDCPHVLLMCECTNTHTDCIDFQGVNWQAWDTDYCWKTLFKGNFTSYGTFKLYVIGSLVVQSAPFQFDQMTSIH